MEVEAPVLASFRLSPQQQHVWRLMEAGGEAAFRVRFTISLCGALDVGRLERALARTVERHESLRTSSLCLPGLTLPSQVIAEEGGVRLTFGPPQEEDVPGPAAEPVLALRLEPRGPQEHALHGSLPALFCDFPSLSCLVRDLAAAYAGDGEEEAPPQCADLAEWQHELLEADEGRLLWRRRAEEIRRAAAILLPFTGDGRGETFRPAAVPVELGAAVAARLSALPGGLEAALLALWQVLLWRRAGGEEVLVGVASAGRKFEGLGQAVSPLARYLPLPARPAAGEVFSRRAAETAAALAEARDWEEYFTWEDLPGMAPPGEEPFWPYTFSFFEMPPSEVGGGVTFRLERAAGATERFVAELCCCRIDGAVAAEIAYHPAALVGWQAQELGEAFESLAAAAGEGMERTLGELPVVGPGELARLLAAGTGPAAEPVPGLTLHGWFFRQAAETPDRTAVIASARHLSYGELAARAGSLAAVLAEGGVGAGSRVALLCERALEMVVGILAVLRAGAAYLPIDPANPDARLAFLLEDAAVCQVLTQRRMAGRLRRLGREPLLLDERRPDLPPPPEAGGGEGEVAYVIYTSGSTGTPKGVEIEHRAICHRLLWAQREYPLGQDDRVLQTAAFGFDFAVWEIFAPLVHGAGLLLPEPGEHQDAARLVELIADGGVTAVHFVPSLLHLLLEQADLERCRALRYLLSGGEVLTPDLVRRLNRRLPAVEVINQYGPAEATVDVSFRRCPRGEERATIPIGRPVANTRLHVLDRQGAPAPAGVWGEILIAGAHLARGYLKRPERTAASFVPDPFSSVPGERLYRTGDRGRFELGGELEFGGRLDHQVKVRGARIELGEVEAALAGHPRVREAVAEVREWSPGDQRLVAYLVAAPGEPPGSADLLAHLSRQLPEYMLPSTFVQLAEMPRNAAGKIDRRALPLPAGHRPETGNAYVAPGDAVEEEMARLWAEVLKVDRVGVHDNFFALGGHSLLAIRLTSRLRQSLEAEVKLRDLFEAPTIAALARRVQSAGSAAEASPLPASLPLVPVPRGGDLLLSFAQERLWFLYLLDPESSAYNVFRGLALDGDLDIPALAAALDGLVDRHESLRTVIADRGHGAVQVVQPGGRRGRRLLARVDLTLLPAAGREVEATRLARQFARRPFDLARGPLLCTGLLHLGEGRSTFLLSQHHIVSDAWSIGILVRELTALYEAGRRGEPAALPELPVQYADYAAWQRSRVDGEEWRRLLAYWRDRLAGVPPLLELPADHPRPRLRSLRGAKLPVDLGTATARIEELARRQGVTPYMLLLAAFQALLGRYAAVDRIPIGTPQAGRTRLELEPLIGFFVNTLVLVGETGGDPPFADFLSRVRNTVLDADAHQELPFEKLVEEIQPVRDTSYTPLFQVMFAFEDEPEERLAVPRLGIRPVDVEGGTAKFDLILNLARGGRGFAGTLEYATDLFEHPTAERIRSHFTTLLEGALANPAARLSELPLLSPAELTLLRHSNETARPFPGDRPLHELFEEQTRRAPDRQAVSWDGEVLTYDALDRRANRWARFLHGLGVGLETRVGLLFERSPEIVVAMLAVLKVGGTYLPLDPSYPDARLALMVADAGAAVVLAGPGFSARDVAGSAIRVDVALIEGNGGSSPPPVPALPGKLAYVLYTSGSTGRPKGVMVPESAVVRLVRGTDYLELAAGDRVAQIANPAFDAATFEIWGALVNGGTLVGIPREVTLAPRELARVLRDERIDSLFLTTALFQQVAREVPAAFAPVRDLLVGGEILDPRHPREVLAAGPPARLLHVYGPTETTTFATWHQVAEVAPGAATVPIGHPLANGRVHVVDAAQRPVPLGVAGELLIGGAGLARGYLGLPGLTAERFVPDGLSGNSGGRLYRTGDRVRQLATGAIDFIGRFDFQVKVRGFRIEPGEIEAALAEHPQVEEALAVAREDGPDSRMLVAYLVPVAGTSPTPAELRDFLCDRLPEPSIPSAFVALAAWPLNAHGKVDRRALPEAQGDLSRSSSPFAAPRTPLEEVVALLWAELLQVERVGVDDDFFALGGHSLLATRLTSRVAAACGVELPLGALFEGPTLGAYVRAVERALAGGAEVPPIAPEARPERIPLSFAQERLWFLQLLAPASFAYNIFRGLRLEGEVEVAALAAALAGVMARHEVLRTTFGEEGGSPFQIVHPPQAPELPVIDLEALPAAVRAVVAAELAGQIAERPFDLARGPLFAARLLRLEARRWDFLLVQHHAVSDGWSMGILVRELTALYDAGRRRVPALLPELPVQYADYAIWQRRRLTGAALAGLLDVWHGRLGASPSLLPLPTDRPRPPVPSLCGAKLSVALPGALALRLEELARRFAATPFMFLLAAFQALLSRYTAEGQIPVGIPVAGRDRREVEGLAGCFVNTLVIVGDAAGDPGFDGFVGRVREAVLEAQVHQEMPFEKLVEELHPRRDLSHSPLFQVMFAFADAPPERLTVPAVAIGALDVANRSAKFDLTLSLEREPSGFRGSLEYATDLFDRATAERLRGHLVTLLGGALAEPAARLSELPLLSPAEREAVFGPWNRTLRNPPGYEPIHRLFERQVDLTPEAVAVEDGESRLSFRDLDRRANRLAGRLCLLGVGADVAVGILLERSADLLAALLAVLKAGGAFVPLDPAHPEERLRFQLEDSGAAVLIAGHGAPPALAAAVPRVLHCGPGDEAAGEAEGRPAESVSPDQLAYILYTSGSTGRPKGVLVSHRGITNYLTWAVEHYAVAAGGGVPVHTSVAFDLTLTSLLAPLLAGRAAVLVRQDGDPQALARLLAERPGLGPVKLTPSHLELLAGALPAAPPGNGETAGPAPALIVGGEALRGEALAAWRRFAPGSTVFNEYGPTETVVGCAVHAVLPGQEAAGPVPIGGPIAATRLYVLDPRLHLLPVGVAGELSVGGDGVARGYRGRPAATAEAFVPDPWAGEPGRRLYKTGDRALRRPDGILEYLGRLDAQVKVRGLRVEPGEIEALLAGHPAVAAAAVVNRTSPAGDTRLIAFLVPCPGAEVDPAELRRHLALRLPEPMVPAAFVALDQLPLAASGKVDRRALAQLAAAPAERGEAVAAPRNEVELALARMFEELLDVRPVGVRDDFFTLGGHSLLAVRLMARIESCFGRELPLSSLFSGATVERLAELLATGRRPPLSTLVPIQPCGARRPFFCVHPIGGDVLCYYHLANRLGPDQPFYGLQAPGLSEDDGGPDLSIEELARRYLAAARAVQPRGPYLLGGYSFGGVVAFEMAQQLLKSGESVGLLALFDGGAPVYRGLVELRDDVSLLVQLLREEARQRGREWRLSIAEARRLGPEAGLERAVEEARAAGLVAPEIDLGRIRRFLAGYRGRALAVERYEPAVYPGRIDYFRSTLRDEENAALMKELGYDLDDPTKGWSRLTARPVEVHAVPGHHETLVLEPAVEVLAARLEACLERVREDFERVEKKGDGGAC